MLEEALEDVDPKPLPDPGQAGVVGQRLVEGVAEVPAHAEAVGGEAQQLALGADPFEEHHELRLEKDDRVDRGATAIGVRAEDEAADEAEIERRLEEAVEVVGRDQGFGRGGDGLIEPAGLGRAEHG